MDPRDLLVANLGLVDRVVAFVCKRHRLDVADAEEFASLVKLKLIENDYGIIRKFESRSSLSTYLTVVIDRMLLDHRIHLWGKWHASAEAKRLGDTAVELEKLLHRDERTIDEAAAILSVPRDSLAAIAERLPQRGPKRRMVDIAEAESIGTSEEPGFDAERRSMSERISGILQRLIASLPADDRLVLQLHFDSGMTVAQIARSLRLDQKQLYRRVEKNLRTLRTELESNGVAAEEARDLIGQRGVVLDFRLGNQAARPSTSTDAGKAADQEENTR